MKFKLLLMAAACIGMVACSKDDAWNPSADGAKSVVLKVNLPTNTRAIAPDDPYKSGVGSTTISSMDVYFTNANGTIKYIYEIKDADGHENLTNIKKDGLRFSNLEDVSAVYIVANKGDNTVTEPAVEDNINEYLVEIKNQAPSIDQNTVIFAGADTDMDLSADTNVPTVPNYNDEQDIPQPGDQVFSAVVVVRPIISRMEWGKVSIVSEGHTVVEGPDGNKYYVEWENWNPKLVGIYQSNVYLSNNIFGTASNTSLFATPTYATGSIVNGAWAGKDAETNSALAYTGYTNAQYDHITTVYNDTNNGKIVYNNYTDDAKKCIPFHFFVPFAPTSDETDNNNAGIGSLDETPIWHFQLYYPNTNNDGTDPYTIRIYKSDDGINKVGNAIDPNSDDNVLKIAGDFYYPIVNGTDGQPTGLAYANVVKLKNATGTQDIEYDPGMIYTADLDIAPFNITPGFKEATDYNVIVKVNVADFATQAVTPEFDKN